MRPLSFPMAHSQSRMAQAGGSSVHPSLRKHFTTAGAGLMVAGYVPKGQCLLRVRASTQTNENAMYLSAFSRPQQICFAVGFPYCTRLATSLVCRDRKFEVPRAAVLTGTMASEPLNGRRKLQKFVFKQFNMWYFSNLIAH